MKQDLRIVKSKQAIEQSFLSLVEVKGYSNVTLVDVAKKAQVNRNTIYLHYQSKEGLVESIISDRVRAEVNDFDLVKFVKLRNNRKKIENMYRAIFTLFDDNVELYRVFLTDEGLTGFLYSEILKIKKLIMPAFKGSIKNELGIDFILHGVFGILSNYTVYAKGTKEENIKMLTDFTVTNLRRLTY